MNTIAEIVRNHVFLLLETKGSCIITEGILGCINKERKPRKPKQRIYESKEKEYTPKMWEWTGPGKRATAPKNKEI